MTDDSILPIELISATPESTERLGKLLAAELRPGDIVLLDGDLGAGKTVMTRGIAYGLGAKPNVVSPTYTLVIEHPSTGTGIDLFHFDVYRLSGAEEFLHSGLDEYFDGRGVCVVEWGEKISEAVPIDPIRVLITGTGSQRKILISFPVGQSARKDRLVKRILENDMNFK
ncbi:MAG: tRNA (adenosine(37)-N6)-threonylcarbamoyltransferase complex ATPase subunit type 1 TsaE [Clostridiaceae bacterium]|nr:tRNA (adenosine(37)-N6)-threonylcarbamoyltransferase complex ATPase subunit type 1 TsaE [Clostridiaceae bacterium]